MVNGLPLITTAVYTTSVFHCNLQIIYRCTSGFAMGRISERLCYHAVRALFADLFVDSTSKARWLRSSFSVVLHVCIAFVLSILAQSGVLPRLCADKCLVRRQQGPIGMLSGAGPHAIDASARWSAAFCPQLYAGECCRQRSTMIRRLTRRLKWPKPNQNALIPHN